MHHGRNGRPRPVTIAGLFSVALMLALCAAAGRAEARNVYLNGLRLDANVAIKPQTFVGCEVRIDEAGDVYITAKGYKVVQSEAARPPAAPAPAGSRLFWLISKQTRPNATNYDVDVFINDAFVKKVRSTDDAIVIDVSKWVQPGENRVRMIAVKNQGEKRTSMSPVDTLEVLVGEGVAAAGTVTVDKVDVTFKRNASETQNVREDFTFRAP